MTVRPATQKDLRSIAEIGAGAFSGLRPLDRGLEWVEACFSAGPRAEYWVAEDSKGIVGYILWLEKGGFRTEAVIELEQIAVRAERRGKGIGNRLIRASLRGVDQRLARRGSKLKLVEVTTGLEQNALAFYRNVLGAELVAELPDYFRGTEYLLIARRGNRGNQSTRR